MTNPIIDGAYDRGYFEGRKDTLHKINSIIRTQHICDICGNENIDCEDCEFFMVEQYIKQVLKGENV